MPLLQTLEIHEVITTQTVDIQRAGLKRQVRDVANAARNFATGLRRRMNASSNGETDDRAPRPAASEPGDAASFDATTGDVVAMAAAPAEEGASHSADASAETVQ